MSDGEALQPSVASGVQGGRASTGGREDELATAQVSRTPTSTPGRQLQGRGPSGHGALSHRRPQKCPPCVRTAAGGRAASRSHGPESPCRTPRLPLLHTTPLPLAAELTFEALEGCSLERGCRGGAPRAAVTRKHIGAGNSGPALAIPGVTSLEEAMLSKWSLIGTLSSSGWKKVCFSVSSVTLMQFFFRSKKGKRPLPPGESDWAAKNT